MNVANRRTECSMGCPAVARREQRENLKGYYDRLHKVKSGLDIQPPKPQPHLQLGGRDYATKKKVTTEAAYADLKMIQAIARTMTRKQPVFARTGPASLNADARKQEIYRMMQENHRLLDGLESIEPSCSTQDYLAQAKVRQRYVINASDSRRRAGDYDEEIQRIRHEDDHLRQTQKQSVEVRRAAFEREGGKRIGSISLPSLTLASSTDPAALAQSKAPAKKTTGPPKGSYLDAALSEQKKGGFGRAQAKGAVAGSKVRFAAPGALLDTDEPILVEEDEQATTEEMQPTALQKAMQRKVAKASAAKSSKVPAKEGVGEKGKDPQDVAAKPATPKVQEPSSAAGAGAHPSSPTDAVTTPQATSSQAELLPDEQPSTPEPAPTLKLPEVSSKSQVDGDFDEFEQESGGGSRASGSRQGTARRAGSKGSGGGNGYDEDEFESEAGGTQKLTSKLSSLGGTGKLSNTARSSQLTDDTPQSTQGSDRWKEDFEGTGTVKFDHTAQTDAGSKASLTVSGLLGTPHGVGASGSRPGSKPDRKAASGPLAATGKSGDLSATDFLGPSPMAKAPLSGGSHDDDFEDFEDDSGDVKHATRPTPLGSLEEAEDEARPDTPAKTPAKSLAKSPGKSPKSPAKTPKSPKSPAKSPAKSPKSPAGKKKGDEYEDEYEDDEFGDDGEFEEGSQDEKSLKRTANSAMTKTATFEDEDEDEKDASATFEEDNDSEEQSEDAKSEKALPAKESTKELDATYAATFDTFDEEDEDEEEKSSPPGKDASATFEEDNSEDGSEDKSEAASPAASPKGRSGTLRDKSGTLTEDEDEDQSDEESSDDKDASATFEDDAKSEDGSEDKSEAASPAASPKGRSGTLTEKSGTLTEDEDEDNSDEESGDDKEDAKSEDGSEGSKSASAEKSSEDGGDSDKDSYADFDEEY